MYKKCAQLVQAYWQNACQLFPSFVHALWESADSFCVILRIHSTFPHPARVTQQLLHSYFCQNTPVKALFCPPSTMPIITITIYI